ncbi:spore germination protein [Cohnella rhizosphaerae]|uniref:Spore germination protein n=1 Tax=Cohnella rhizosphaerae TaxID=1457232 RepID=A0A9X4KV38_9BACL|nr:spore germination protein [Cohnella rhizosphaerae]MDG0811684.1 spore germination protein [Cohnella rhizosphaerae]
MLKRLVRAWLRHALKERHSEPGGLALGTRAAARGGARASSDEPLSAVLKAFKHVEDLVCQPISAGGVSCTLVYFETIVDKNTLFAHLIRPLREQPLLEAQTLLDGLLGGALVSVQTTHCNDEEQAVSALLEGQAALFIEAGRMGICLFPVTQYNDRAVTESQHETVIVGPQEAFVENVRTNLALVRHKLKHPDFKIEKYAFGRFTKTETYLLYIEGVCNADVLREVKEKLAATDVSSVLGASYLAERMQDMPLSPFPTVQYSERPDTLAAALMEGRIGMMIDGTPQSLIVPVTFFSLMQSAEDYYQNFMASTWIRWIRLFFVAMSFLVPSVYVAVTTFHPEIVPANLLQTITAARENIPFPALAEVLIMELIFEGLREAGIRIPRPLGQTVSIIGAIVIGQATVQAGIVSAPTVIVVSITGIASFVIPHFELGLAFRLLRFPLLLLGGLLGMAGLVTGLFLLFWHLVSLSSFGVPYMHPVAPLSLRDWKDTFIRINWTRMKSRPEAYRSLDAAERLPHE